MHRDLKKKTCFCSINLTIQKHTFYYSLEMKLNAFEMSDCHDLRNLSIVFVALSLHTVKVIQGPSHIQFKIMDFGFLYRIHNENPLDYSVHLIQMTSIVLNVPTD